MTGGEEDWSTDDQSYKKEFDLAAESQVETLVNLPGYASEDRQMDITEIWENRRENTYRYAHEPGNFCS